MDNFKDREKAFEAKFAHDAEMLFKAEARRNRMLAAWVSDKLGMASDEAESYATKLIAADMEEAGDDDVIRRVLADARERNATIDEAELRAQSKELLAKAKAQLMEDRA